jgi:hypothetical protein
MKEDICLKKQCLDDLNRISTYQQSMKIIQFTTDGTHKRVALVCSVTILSGSNLVKPDI